VVGVHFLISSRFDRGVVQSAPSTGAFASGTYSRTDMMRSMSRSGVHGRSADLAESSGSWPRPPGRAAQPPKQEGSQSGRIMIDRDEFE
jgi:hypothetical protein